MPIFEIPPDFHGFVLNTPAQSIDGITLAGLRAPNTDTRWDLWRWGTSAAPPASFSIGGPAQKLTTRAQSFSGPAGPISPAAPSAGQGYSVKWKGEVVGYVAFNVPTSGSQAPSAQWWMYKTPVTTGGAFLPSPTDADPLVFSGDADPSPGVGWKGEDD